MRLSTSEFWGIFIISGCKEQENDKMQLTQLLAGFQADHGFTQSLMK